jgi:hypothetical protein
MSVDYYTCNNCGYNFPDCGHFVSCESCGTMWCSDECAEEDGFVREYCSKHPDLDNRDLMEEYREDHCNFEDCADCEYYNPESCKYCRSEDYEDHILLTKALELLKMSREELVKIINEEE